MSRDTTHNPSKNLCDFNKQQCIPLASALERPVLFLVRGMVGVVDQCKNL